MATITYLVNGTVLMDGERYTHGQEISFDDEKDAERIAELREVHAIQLPAEALPPEQIAAQQEQMQQELAARDARIAELEHELALKSGGE